MHEWEQVGDALVIDNDITYLYYCKECGEWKRE